MTINFSLSPENESTLKTILLNVLGAKKNYSVYVFGSRATGKNKKYSDIDLWIESEPELSQSEISNLLDLLEMSDLSIKADIVTPSTCLPEYLNRIQQERILWFKAQI